MSKVYLPFIMGSVISLILFSGCAENDTAKPTVATTTGAEKSSFAGFENQVKWGEHLVNIVGCSDCHTPKKMTATGPIDDTTLFLSGHPENLPAPDVDRKAMESKGLVVTSDFTSWIGPWGISYSANLTPHETGIGNWTEDQFIYAIKNSISKGVPGSRSLMPPMSMMPVKHMRDEELKAVFAYLRTIKPIKNNSLQPTPPELPRKQ